MIALLVAAMGFAQGQLSSQALKKNVSVEKTHGQLMSQPFKKAAKVSTTNRAVTGTLQNYGTTAQGNAIGTGSAGTLGAAALFETTDLTSYVGQYITKISAGIANASVVTSGKVAIMTGTADAPVVVYEQACTFATGVNDVVLTTPYQIPSGTAIMVGYEIVVTGGYPIACDDGPAVENGDLICIGELGGAFDHMGGNGLDYNNIISATVEDDPSSPLLTVAPNSMVFVGFVGDATTEAQAATISTRNISSDITIATAAPFEVSTDNTTFSASATMAGEGTFYVRYIPATEESTAIVTGAVTISATGADDATIAINAITFDCTGAITTLPYEEAFESGIPCWTYFSNNTENEGRFGISQYEEGNYVFVFSSYEEVENEDYNQYLITPELGFTEDVLLSFDYASYYGAENFRVMISSTDNNIASFTALGDDMTADSDEFTTYNATIPAGTKYIAINYFSDYMYYLFIDNFALRAVPTSAEIALTSVTPANGAAVPSGQDITLSGVVTNNGSALTSYKVAYTVDGGTAVEYTVSDINVETNNTHTFTHATPITGLATGEHTIVVTVSEPNGAADNTSDNSMTVNITITAPLAYGCYFETDPAEEGWSFVDSDNDGNNWAWENSSSTPHNTPYEGIGCLYSASYANGAALTPNNWAISPAIQIENGPITVSFYAKGQDADYAAEHFQIYAGTSADVTAMTAVSEEYVATGEYLQYSVNLPASYVGQTLYVAIRHFNVSDEFVLVVDNFEVLAYGHVATDIEENIADAIAVYPNPTSSMVTIANAEGKDIIVVNSLGQVVASIENAAANQTIDVANFANGTYFVKVDGEVVKLNVVK